MTPDPADQIDRLFGGRMPRDELLRVFADGVPPPPPPGPPPAPPPPPEGG